MLAEDAVSDAVPGFLGVDHREVEAVEELGKGSAGAKDEE